MADKTMTPEHSPGPLGDVTPRRFFKHYRTGKIYDAHDYGHKAWPIPSRTAK